MEELVKYLISNLYLDFQGDVSAETLRDYLREDDSREARKVLAKIIDDTGVDDMLLTLADCLREHLRAGVHEGTVREQLNLYADS